MDFHIRLGTAHRRLARPAHPSCHILEMNGQSYRLATSKKAQPRSAQGQSQNPKTPSEGAPPKYKSARKQENKPGLHSPFLSTRLVQYLAAIWHILSPPLTAITFTF